LHEVVVFSKEGCHLCEKAIEVLNQLSRSHSLRIQILDITKNSQLLEKYSIEIPVVQLDGGIVFHASDINALNDIELKLTAAISDLRD
jgi:glutaredoxin